jgi:hypothetical protein
MKIKNPHKVQIKEAGKVESKGEKLFLEKKIWNNKK